MPKWLSNILPYISIPVLIAVGTIVYKTGSKDTSVSYQIKDLSGLTQAIKIGFDSIEYKQAILINAVNDLRWNVIIDNQKLNSKLDAIVENVPNNDKLIRQLYEIEKSIKRKNDTIDMLTMKNEALKRDMKINAKRVEEDKW